MTHSRNQAKQTNKKKKIRSTAFHVEKLFLCENKDSRINRGRMKPTLGITFTPWGAYHSNS